MGCSIGKVERPSKKRGESSGNHSNQKVAKETNKADQDPVITAEKANSVNAKSPLKPNGDITADTDRNTCQNNSENTAEQKGRFPSCSVAVF